MVKTVFCLFFLASAGALMQCSPADETVQDQQHARVDTVAQRPIDSVLADHTAEWMAIPGVVGTGIGECDRKPCIKVFVIDRTTEIEQKIPKTVENYTVDIQVTGEFKANDSV